MPAAPDPARRRPRSSAGIAVGIATKIPPHNLREVVSGLAALVANPDISTRELMQHVPAPDFPTGARHVLLLGRLVGPLLLWPLLLGSLLLGRGCTGGWSSCWGCHWGLPRPLRSPRRAAVGNAPSTAAAAPHQPTPTPTPTTTNLQAAS